MRETESQAFWRAALRPGPLVVAALTALGAYFLAPWLMVPGALLYLLIVYSTGPARVRRARLHEELGLDLRDAPPGLKRWNTVLRETLARIELDLKRGEGDNARILRPVGDEVEALGDDIRRLIRQAYALHRYLNNTNVAMINARVAQLEAQIATTQDDFSRQQLAEAVEALRRQLANCEHIRVLIGRTEATLENMQASLQSIGSSVVKLTAGEFTDVSRASQDSLERLSSARSTVSALEDVLEQVELA